MESLFLNCMKKVFLFFIVNMPQIDINIPNLFYSGFIGETFSIACSTPHFPDFLPENRELVSRILRQGGKVRKCHLSSKKNLNNKKSFLSLLMMLMIS